jgi:HPt (histidine-containing phosphotransfer) domain-containing protein
MKNRTALKLATSAGKKHPGAPTVRVATSNANTWSELVAEGPAELRDMLIEGTHADLHEAFAALRTGNLPRVAFVAHRMKSAARLIASEEAESACAALEIQCREQCIGHVNVALDRVESSFAAAWQRLGPAPGSKRD